MSAQRIQTFTPEALIGVNPSCDFTQRLGFQPVEYFPTISATSHEGSFLQDAQMLGDRRQRDLEGRRQIQYGFFLLREGIKKCAAGWIGNRSKDQIHAKILFKHMLKCQYANKLAGATSKMV
jgi:hypothetical protein